jgi:predicted  nucleic acid-binding Zn-ribbon protein
MTRNERPTKAPTATHGTISVSVENIGGIGEGAVTLTPGVNVLTGPNATNRTSLLRAIAGGLGGSAGVLRRGAKRASVRLSWGDDEYSRRYERMDETVRTSGEPYSDEETVVDLFVSLLENNPIRRAVRSGSDLTDLLLAPVDTDQLENRIATLRSERERIDERLNEIDRERKRLPKLRKRKNSLEADIETLESELDDLRDRAEAETPDDPQSEQAESIRQSFETIQTELERTESELETQREIRDELKSELENVREGLDEYELRKQELDELNREIERLQAKEAELSTTINDLSTVLKQNREVLSGDDTVVAELATTADPLDELDPQSQSIECWTCGSQVQRGAIASQLDDIEGLVEKKRRERDTLREELSTRRSERDDIRQEREQYETLTERETELERELERRTESIQELVADADALRDELSDKQATLESLDEEADNEQFAAYERISELEYERGQLAQELREIDDEINEIEYQLGKSDDLEARRGDLTEQIEDLRSRVDDIEREATETFNDHMASVLDHLGYDNIERVWLERRNVGDETTFDLHIVREDEGGTVYEDSVDHLSESEREVVGLVVALTGYLTHDVEEEVPLLLLDSLEAIDADRIAALIEYVVAHTEFLVLALLEEDAAELPEQYHRIPAIEHLS